MYNHIQIKIQYKVTQENAITKPQKVFCEESHDPLAVRPCLLVLAVALP